MARIPENINADITPKQFEELVYDYLNSTGASLKDFQVVHDTIMNAHDGSYQIDIKATFEALKVTFTVLIECKRHKSAIKREVVQALHDKIRSLGAHKGIVFSTANFQQGAKDYALQHGIALVRVIEGRYTYQTKSAAEQTYDPPPWANIPKFVGEYNYEGNYYTYLQPGNMEEFKNFILSKDG